MKGNEIVRELEQKGVGNDAFIHWRGMKGDTGDYDTVRAFRENTPPEREFAGYELLDIEEMWGTLEMLCPERISREEREDGEFIVWSHDSGAGEMVSEDCPFSPEAVMTIFAIEARGKTLV